MNTTPLIMEELEQTPQPVAPKDVSIAIPILSFLLFVAVLNMGGMLLYIDLLRDMVAHFGG